MSEGPLSLSVTSNLPQIIESLVDGQDMSKEEARGALDVRDHLPGLGAGPVRRNSWDTVFRILQTSNLGLCFDASWIQESQCCKDCWPE